METEGFIPFRHQLSKSQEEMIKTSRDLYAKLKSRRTIREYSETPVPREVIENCLRAAGTAPSGANRQPWKFVVVESPEIKQKIRTAAEAEEKLFYEQRAPDEWLQALKPFKTNCIKSYLEKAPYLIAIFSEFYKVNENNEKVVNYYPKESTGIATGLLITSLHLSGLSTLTHTPSPMGFFNEVLDVPTQYKPFLLLVVGHAAENAMVPNNQRKTLGEIADFR